MRLHPAAAQDPDQSFRKHFLVLHDGKIRSSLSIRVLLTTADRHQPTLTI